MTSQFPQSRSTAQPQHGQSLVEFVLIMPILVLVAIAGASFGIATHQAHMVADAVQFPSAKKLQLANKTEAVGTGELQGYMNGGSLKDNLTKGSVINSVNLVNSDQYTSIMIGSRQATPPLNMAAFTIKSGQVINRNLVEAANAGAEVRPYKTAWVPGGTMNPPTWTEGGDADKEDGEEDANEGGEEDTETPPAEGGA